jgi:hypothetical protein
METYRASEFGGCTKMLVAKRLGMKPHESVPETMQKAFDRGNRHEVACLATMVDEGWDIGHHQLEVIVKHPTLDVQVVGHIDAMSLRTTDRDYRLIEVKAPQAWRRFVDEQWLDDPSPMVERYKWQISCYMLGLGSVEAVLACLDEGFQLRYHGIEMPPYSLQDICDRMEMLEEMASHGYAGMPKLCQPREYPCPYYNLHEDENISFAVDSQLDTLVGVRSELNAQAATIKKKVEVVNEEIKDIVRAKPDRKVVTENSKVSLYDRTNVRYDYRKMRAEGIDVDRYKSETVTKDILKAVSKDDEEDTA